VIKTSRRRCQLCSTSSWTRARRIGLKVGKKRVLTRLASILLVPRPNDPVFGFGTSSDPSLVDHRSSVELVVSKLELKEEREKGGMEKVSSVRTVIREKRSRGSGKQTLMYACQAVDPRR